MSNLVANRLKETIDRAIEPAAMSKGAAVDVLEEIADHCRASLEALREEMGDD